MTETLIGAVVLFLAASAVLAVAYLKAQQETRAAERKAQAALEGWTDATKLLRVCNVELQEAAMALTLARRGLPIVPVETRTEVRH